mgnify:CR=1 FL=1
MATIVMVGATSGIGSATAREFAQAGYDLVLAGRNMEKLSRLGADLGIRFGVRTEIISYDALLPEAGTRLYEQIVERFDPDGLIIFHGALPDPAGSREWPVPIDRDR